MAQKKLSLETFVAFPLWYRKNNAASGFKDKLFFPFARTVSGCTRSSIIVFSSDETSDNFDEADCVDGCVEKQLCVSVLFYLYKASRYNVNDKYGQICQ